MATKRSSKRVKFSKVEKLMLKLCAIILVAIPVASVFSKATLAKVNLEVEQLKGKIATQEKVNESLTMKIDELKSYENVQAVITSYGLAYNNDNIKVIDGQ